jgi:hypothetical protein
MTMPMPAASQSRSTEHGLADLIEELSARMETGEPVDLQAYLDAHPEHAVELRRLYPALQLLADFSRSGVANLPPDGLEPVPVLGTPLGDFRLVREIGRGGIGVVYEAEQLSLGRSVALKVLPFASTLDAQQLQRFKNEAQAAAHLHHQSIVPVFATGCERGVHYYAMQFIDGHTLAWFIAELRARAERENMQLIGYQPSPPGAFDRFFESMAYSGLGDKANARRCYDEGVQWMQKNAPDHPDLHRFRSEAAARLGFQDASSTKAKERTPGKE